jgi:hypothetical protein
MFQNEFFIHRDRDFFKYEFVDLKINGIFLKDEFVHFDGGFSNMNFKDKFYFPKVIFQMRILKINCFILKEVELF